MIGLRIGQVQWIRNVHFVQRRKLIVLSLMFKKRHLLEFIIRIQKYYEIPH